MSKALSTMILIIGGFIFGALFVTNVLPAIARTGNAIIADRTGFKRARRNLSRSAMPTPSWMAMGSGGIPIRTPDWTYGCG